MAKHKITATHLAAIAQAAVDLVSITDTAPYRPRLAFSVDASVVRELRQCLVDGDFMDAQVKTAGSAKKAAYVRPPPCNHKQAKPKPGSLEALLRDTRADRDKYRKAAEKSGEIAVALGDQLVELQRLEQGRGKKEGES